MLWNLFLDLCCHGFMEIIILMSSSFMLLSYYLLYDKISAVVHSDSLVSYTIPACDCSRVPSLAISLHF